MRWKIPGDDSRPVISAQEHISGAHGSHCVCLPETCVLFEMGTALPCLQELFDTQVLSEHLPCFIADSKCIRLRSRPGVCFVSGGYGAPAAADTLETLRALGVRRVLVAGMCGGFGQDIRVGDVVVPERILCEEGTSLHYIGGEEFALPDPVLHSSAAEYFARGHRVLRDALVTCDAFYRQTFRKEEQWRQKGCVAVDMESSALLNIASYYGMPAAAALLCSDRHPLSEGSPKWKWGGEGFSQSRRRFVRAAAELALSW